jgi:hypothetical protein
MNIKIISLKFFFKPSLLLCLVSSFYLLSCCTNENDCHNTLILKNNSQNSIYYVTTLKENFFNYDPTNEIYSTDFLVEPGENQKVRIGISLSCWEQVMSSASGYLYIYIYDANSIEADGWDESRAKYIKKFKLDAKQLNKMNWIVTYP